MVREGAITAPVAQRKALQEGRMRGAARFGLVLLSAQASFATVATAAAELPIYSAREKPSTASIQKFLEGGVSWGDDQGEAYEFWPDGTASHEDKDETSFKGESRCRCQRRGLVSVNGPTLRFDCPYSCSDGASGLKEFSLRALFAARELLVYRDRNGRTVAVDGCAEGMPSELSRSCAARSVKPGGRFFLLEIIPAASNSALFQAVRKRLQDPGPDHDGTLRGYALLFEGPPARTPRAETEVFFANGKKDTAALVAEALEVVIGPVTAKPWPGSWDYDVIVVVGARKAAAGK